MNDVKPTVKQSATKQGSAKENSAKQATAKQEPGPVEPRREDGRKRRWRAHREARRAQMVESAVRAIHQYGTNVSMEDIAAEAGVSKPVLYRHFTDQADLYVAVGQQAAETLVAEITAELEHTREPRAHVAAVIDTYLRAIERDPDLYRFVTRRSFADRPVESDPVTDYGTLVATELTRVFGERLREAGVDSGGAEPWGRGIVGLVQSAGDWWLDNRSMSRASLTEYLTLLIWNGFSGILASGNTGTAAGSSPAGAAGAAGPAGPGPALSVVPGEASGGER